MSEVVEEHPSLIPVINRFGIRLGLGDKSVKAICEESTRFSTRNTSRKRSYKLSILHRLSII